jgi:DNA methylase
MAFVFDKGADVNWRPEASSHSCTRPQVRCPKRAIPVNLLRYFKPEYVLKPKDDALIPACVALDLQADGWWVRSKIVWVKPNAMPESVKDRPRDVYEDIFMLTKSAHFYWDAIAVREPASDGTHSRGKGQGGPKQMARESEGLYKGWCDATRNVLSYRNLRNVWSFPTQPFSGAHFAGISNSLGKDSIDRR